MKMKSTAAELREALAERGLTNVKAAQLLGVHRDTLQRWLQNNQVPSEQITRLRTMDVALPSYRGEFEIRLAQQEMTIGDFCDLTGVTAAEVKAWKDQRWVPKWAVVILRQRQELNELMKERSAAVAPQPAVTPVIDPAAKSPLDEVLESFAKGPC